MNYSGARCYWPDCLRQTEAGSRAIARHIVIEHLGGGDMPREARIQPEHLLGSLLKKFESEFGQVEDIFNRMRTNGLVTGDAWNGEDVSICKDKEVVESGLFIILQDM